MEHGGISEGLPVPNAYGVLVMYCGTRGDMGPMGAKHKTQKLRGAIGPMEKLTTGSPASRSHIAPE